MKRYKLIILSTLSLMLLGAGIFSASFNNNEIETEAASFDTKGIPSGYYDNVKLSSASALYKSLISIAKKGYKTYSYDNLEVRMRNIDWDASGVDDSTKVGRMVDIYSNITCYKKNDDSGTYKNEGDCWNKEHLIPKSWWGDNKNGPNNEGCDCYNMYPTDGKINGMRSNYPMGEVGSSYNCSANNFSKWGSAKSDSGYTGTVFEPNDKYKGDIARSYFYFATKNQNDAGTAGSTYTKATGGNVVFSSSKSFMLTDYAANLFYKWHKLDPVSDWERLRCDQAYAEQGNRNPYIDHPEYVDYIWGGVSPEITKVTSVTLSPTMVDIKTGESQTITATVLPTNATDKSLTWTTNDSSIATVNEGVISGVGVGSCTVTATTNDGSMISSSVSVTVAKGEDIKVTGISLNPVSATVKVGESQTIVPTISPSNATDKTVSWSSNDDEIATVTNGVVNAIKEGTCTITATANDGSGVTGTCEIKVESGGSPKYSTILINKTNYSGVGDYNWYCFNDVDGGTLGQMYVYSQNGQNYLQFNPNKTGKGLFTTVNKSGLSKIVVQTLSSTNEVAWYVRMSQIQFTKDNYDKGDYLGTFTSKKGVEVTFNIPEEYSSYPFVSLIPASTQQCKKIELVYGEQEPEVRVTGISLSDSNITLLKGASKTLSATIKPSNATNKAVTWSSSNENVASVNNGVVTANSVGTAIITATTNDGGFTAQCSVTVNEEPPAIIHVTSISLPKTSSELTKGSTETLIPTILPVDATDKSVTWETSNDKVVTVNNGVVTAVGTGIATVTVATVDGHYTASCSFTVKETEIKVNSINITEQSLTLSPQQTYSLNVTVGPENATNKNLSWSSSDNNVATVGNGIITAFNEGTCVITASSTDGSQITASVSITVKKAESKGCSGSIAGTSIIIFGLSFVGIALLNAKKKRK